MIPGLVATDLFFGGTAGLKFPVFFGWHPKEWATLETPRQGARLT